MKNIVSGKRLNTSSVYLSEAVLARPNLFVRAQTQVDRIEFDQKRTTGVRLVDGEVIPAEQVVISAGVYGSPAVLLRSGVGPEQHLQEFRIPVIVDLPVGERLQDQPMYTVTYQLKPSVESEPVGGSGVVWTASQEAIGDELDLQLSLSVQPDFDAAGRRIRLLRIWAAVVLPRSFGTVRLKSRNPLVTPRIDYNLLDDASDQRRLKEAVKLARSIATHDPIASMIDKEVTPGSAVENDEALTTAIRAGLMTYYHGTSTLPMGGEGDPHAVVDSKGAVRGIEGLRVVDASIFPEIISSPTNLTTLMLAEHIAALLRT